MEKNARSLVSKIDIKTAGYFTIILLLLVFGTNWGQTGVNWWHEVAIFALLSLLAQLAPARLPQGYNFSLAFVLDLILIALYGPPIAIITRFAVNLLAGIFTKFLGTGASFQQILKTTAEGVLVIELTGLAYQGFGESLGAFGAATIVYFFANTFFASFYEPGIKKEQFFYTWISVIRSLFIYFLVLSPLAYILTSIVKDISVQWKIFSVMLFFVPVLLVSHALRLYFNIRQSYLDTVKTMVRAIEAKDSYMKGHSEHVAELTLAMAKQIGMREKELQQLEYVVLLHDAGKIGVSEKISNKPGALSPEEYIVVQKHSALSAEIISKINFLSHKSKIVRHHHERYDGEGYPDGLAGEAIPLASRILAIADAYDAMITDRPFRSAKTPVEALREIENLGGRQFDPSLVKQFSMVLKRLGEL